MIRKTPIIAIATAPGRAGVGIIRLSGENLSPIAESLLGKKPIPRYASLFAIRDRANQSIDQALALYFPAPASFTGEDVFELHCHGGPQLLELVLKRCLEIGAEFGLEIANPGEFSLRAFLNNKIDLTQAEAISDLIDAQSEAAVRGAVRSLQGIFSEEINSLIEEITQLRILVESTLDFPEEEIEFLQDGHAKTRLDVVMSKVTSLLKNAGQGKILRDGIQLVLVGAPNVGKSSLLNCLAGEEIAIVTPIAGTTRDRVRESIVIDGVPLHVIDTAGLRETVDEVEAKGIERTWDAIKAADLVIFLSESRLNQNDQGSIENLELKGRVVSALSPRCVVLEVINKADLLNDFEPNRGVEGIEDILYISAKTGFGIAQLKNKILQAVGWTGVQEGGFVARRRHLDCLGRAEGHLNNAKRLAVGGNQSLELFAEELRLAQDRLGEITGKLLPDDLLGKIFSQFCIGK